MSNLKNLIKSITILLAAVVLVVSGIPVLSGNNSKVSAQTSNLPYSRIPWEGGPDYYKVSNGPQFAKADAAGWDEPEFISLSVFVGKMQDAARYKSLGLNTYMGMEHNVAVYPLNSVTDTGMFVQAQGDWLGGEWTQAEIGNNANVVSWLISDECEMGYSNCTPDWNNDNGESGRLGVQQSYVTQARNYNDGRFLHANFGNGIVRTFWAPTTMDDHIALLDTSSADKYSYTSPGVDDLFINAPDWPAGANPISAASYGWQVDQMKRFQNPNDLRPIWTFIETARPFLNEPGARTITPNQIEGAVWSSIIHEARGIAYFMHNNDPACGDNSPCEDAMEVKLTAVNTKITSLAPVLNTQSYYNDTFSRNGFNYQRFTFNNGTDTMLKSRDGFAYVFAGIGLNQSTGNKTFELPDGVEGANVEVVGESRSIPVDQGTNSFTDNFAAEYSHHVYKISIDPENPSIDKPLFRLYAPSVNYHFWTASSAERDWLTNVRKDFVLEGNSGKVASTPGTGLVPLYRLYAPSVNKHFWTTSSAEKDWLAITRGDFVYEGITGYVSSSPGTGLTPLYRLYAPSANKHFWTNSSAERDWLAITRGDFNSEGTTGYVGQ